MTIALALANSQGVLLAADGRGSRRLAGTGSWRYDYETKINWFPGQLAACVVAGFSHTTGPSPDRFGLLSDPTPRPNASFDFATECRSLYGPMDASSEKAWRIQPGFEEEVHESWQHPSLIGAAYSRGPQLVQIHRAIGALETEVSVAGVGEVIAGGAWHALGTMSMMFKHVPWERAMASMDAARRLVRSLLEDFIDTYEQSPAAAERRARVLPLSIGRPVRIVVIKKDSIEVEDGD